MCCAPMSTHAIDLAGDSDAGPVLEQQFRCLRAQLQRCAQRHQILGQLAQYLVRPAVLPVVARA